MKPLFTFNEIVSNNYERVLYAAKLWSPSYNIKCRFDNESDELSIEVIDWGSESMIFSTTIANISHIGTGTFFWGALEKAMNEEKTSTTYIFDDIEF